MRIPSSQSIIAFARPARGSCVARPAKGVRVPLLIAFALSSVSLLGWPSAAESQEAKKADAPMAARIEACVADGMPAAESPNSPKADAPMAARIEALIPDLEACVADGMKAFDLPGLAIGIVTGDRLVYGKGFGVRSKGGGAPVDTRTVFQIASTTKAFLAATMAIAVDGKEFQWDDRIVDLDPTFQLKDPWVTREFRVFDLIAQRSGLPPYANDRFAELGYDQDTLIRSLRHVEPMTSFRSTFAYTNITHLVASRIVAKALDAPDWDAVAQSKILDPLGMKDTSFTAEAIKAAANHAEGHRWTPSGTVEVPFVPTGQFPYVFRGVGDINSTIEDMARWVRLHLGKGTFEERPPIVSPENLAVTYTPQMPIGADLNPFPYTDFSGGSSYALGWMVTQTPNGSVVWHNGGSDSFGAYVGMLLDQNVGVVVLTNVANEGLPDAIGFWVFDRLLDNPPVDWVAYKLEKARTGFEETDKLFAKPASPRPVPPLAPLTGSFTNPSFGRAVVRQEGDVLAMELEASGAQLKLAPWDGGVFTASLMPLGRLAAMAATMGPRPIAFAQFQMDKLGRLDVLRLTFDDGQVHEFRREEMPGHE